MQKGKKMEKQVVTNGDIIEALFPDYLVLEFYDMMALIDKQERLIEVNKDFWNAPYKREVEE